MPGAGLVREDRGVRHQLHVCHRDLGGVGVEDDRAVHLCHLVEERGRIVDVQLDPAGVEKAEVVGLADHDEAARVSVQDAVEPLPQRRAGSDHLQRPHQSRLCPYIGVELFAGPERHGLSVYAIYHFISSANALRRAAAGPASRQENPYATAFGRRAPGAGSASDRACASVAASHAPVPLPGGASTALQPCFAASSRRRSGWPTQRSSPVRPNSPKQARGVSCSATPKLALATASATARSQPGSSTRTPPTTFTNTSAPAVLTRPWRCRIASTSARRLRSSPDTTRRGCSSSDGATSACTSTSSEREPSIAASTTLPGARVASATKRAEASSTSHKPPC